MKYEALSAALDQISDRHIAQAFAWGQRRRLLRRACAGAVAAAIILVMLVGLPLPGSDGIITAPGVLVVTAYADEINPAGVEMQEGIEVVTELSDLVLGNGTRILQLELSLPERYGSQITFSVENINSIMYTYDLPGYPNLSIRAMIPNHRRIAWNPNPNGVDYETEGSFLTIVIRDGEHIIGYALIQGYLHPTEENCMTAKLVKSVCYPKMWGSFQTVTEEYVREQLQQAMQTALIGWEGNRYTG